MCTSRSKAGVRSAVSPGVVRSTTNTAGSTVERSRRSRSRRHGRRRRRGGPTRRVASRRPSATAVIVSAPRASAPVIDPAATAPSHRALLVGVAAVGDGRRELRRRADERRRVVRPAELLEQDRQLDPAHARGRRAPRRSPGPASTSSTIVAHHPAGSMPSSITERTNDGEHSLSTMPRTVSCSSRWSSSSSKSMRAPSVSLCVVGSRRWAGGASEQVEISLHPDENDNFTTTGNLREDECDADIGVVSNRCDRVSTRFEFRERDEQLWGSGTNRTC